MGAIYRNGYKYGDGNGVAQNPVLAIKSGDELYKPENGVVELPSKNVYRLSVAVTDWDESGAAEIDVIGTFGYNIPANNHNELILSPSETNMWRQYNVRIDTVNRDTTTGNITTIELSCDIDNIPEHTIQFCIVSSKVERDAGASTDRICVPPGLYTDTSFDNTSTNPVQNKVIKAALDSIIDDSVATSTSTYSSEKVEDLLDEAAPKKIDTASARPKLDEIGEAIDVAFSESILDGSNVWTDGKDIYYSLSGTHYIFDKATSTWSAKTWSGVTSFYGKYIWTDGENIYCSNSSNQYVLDKSTSTWSTKTWTGLTSFDGNKIWTDGENIYCSNGTDQYVLDKSTSTWSAKTWSGLTNLKGQYIWTDGENIYYSNNSEQYVLNKATSTWSTKTWSGLTAFFGYYSWTDGENIYCSNGTDQYVLDKSTSTWSAKTWTGTGFVGNGSFIWTDGENIYYSNTTSQKKLIPKPKIKSTRLN